MLFAGVWRSPDIGVPFARHSSRLEMAVAFLKQRLFLTKLGDCALMIGLDLTLATRGWRPCLVGLLFRSIRPKNAFKRAMLAAGKPQM